MSSFKDFMEQFRARPVYFEKLSGNNGDKVIELGAQQVLEQVGAKLCDRPESSEVILVNGGGAMNDIWMGGLKAIARYSEKYPLVPMVVAPSSFRFNDITLLEFVASRKSSLTLFAREMESYGELQRQSKPAGCRIFHSQDLAFELANSAFHERLLRSSKENHVLIAIRKDKEGDGRALLQRIDGRFLPKVMRKPLSVLRDRMVAFGKSDATSKIIKSLGSRLPRVYRDISVSVEFDDFIDIITSSSAILTDRLHVAIVGSLAGKPVWIFENSYHKNRAVHAYSLSDSSLRITLVKSS